MNVYKLLFLTVLFTLFSLSCSNERDRELTVLQLNLWVQGANVEGAPQGVVDLVVQTNPDIVLLCELNAGSEHPFVPWLVEELKKRGKTYFGDDKNAQVGILAKYPLANTTLLLPTEERHRPLLKAQLDVSGRIVTAYSAHMDHLHYACYLPRGASAMTWKKIDAPVTDPDSILAVNRDGFRDEYARSFLADAERETAKGHIVILGGDFNEPSHLDWREDTKDMRCHGGAVVDWDVSLMLQAAGYIDTYRQCHPNAVTHPGFTYPAGNTAARLESLHCVPDADERDRIDFIYYSPHPGLKLTSAHIVGPPASVLYGKISPPDAADEFIEPRSVWPTDHKGNLAKFELRIES
ncbi:MAG: endonuclease/exonuclease/phosphatase family protein [Tannerellaceae bacterium]|jgi:exonuclease III|nr:endonuclease/exonuclease/phosphatase family protein [Tannerellaceae bacterium]